MRKISFVLLILAVFGLAFSVYAYGVDTVVNPSIEENLYIGEYETDGHDGMANVVFGTVDKKEIVYGVIITDENGQSVAFPGKEKSADGKFGVAIYNMKRGERFFAQVYAGSYDNTTASVSFYANLSNEIVVTYDMTDIGGGTTQVSLYENTILNPPSTTHLTPPSGAVFGGWFTKDGERFDLTKEVNKDITLYAGWETDGVYGGKQFAYARTANYGNRTNIGSSIPVDLSDGSSISMEMDVLSSNLSGNFQIEVNVMAWLPSGTNGTIYNNSFTSTGYVSFSGNSAYTSAQPDHYYGYVSNNGPSTIDKSRITFASKPFIPKSIFTAGKTVRMTYTAPTASKTGSITIYTKSSYADDTEYTLAAGMYGLTLSDVYDTSKVWLWFSFTGTGARGSQNMTFKNYKVYRGDQNLPVMLFNHYDTDIKITDCYETEMEKAYDLTVSTSMDGSKGGYLVSAQAVDMSLGGSIAMEMDVLRETFWWQNVNYGPVIWRYLGISNVFGSGFHDMFWYGNPMYKNDKDGYSFWKDEDLSNKTLPEISKLCVEDIWKEGNSVKIVYDVPTDTKSGSIVIYTKLIEQSDAYWTEMASVRGLKKDMVLDTSEVIIGFGIMRTVSTNTEVSMKLANVRAYTSLGDIPVVYQLHGTYVEDTSYVPEYRVAFDVNGGTGKVDDLWVKKGSNMLSLDASGMTAPDGMEFECWVDEYAMPVNLSSPVTRHMKLKAKWQKDWGHVFNVSDGIITGLTDYGKTLVDITVPSTIYGEEITAIGYGAFQGSMVENLTIAKNVRFIYDDAFRGIESLDVVTFENGSLLRRVGDSAFRDCPALSNISLPSSVRIVGELAFFGSENSGYDKLYSLNLQEKEYYSNKYVYEFLGEDVMPINAYIEPSVGYFAEGVTLEQVMQDFVDSGCNNLINVGQMRYGTTSAHYLEMLEHLEKMGGVMTMKSGYQSYWDDYASYGGCHIVDEPGVVSWVPGMVVYNDDTTAVEASMGKDHLAWTQTYKRKLYYVNLLAYSTYPEASVYGAHHANNLSLRELNVSKTWSQYSQYASNPDFYYGSYIENVNPKVLSYDYYPLKGEYPSLSGGHFEQLYYSNYYAQVYNEELYGYRIPFWNFVQVNGWLSGTANGVITTRAANYNELLWQINTALAFGSKGYQYYCYNDYGDISGGGKPSNWWDTPINIDGTKNKRVYDTVQNVNMQSQSMAKWLLNADFDHLSQVGANPNGETIRQFMFTARDKAMNWSLVNSTGVNHLVSYMQYYANNNEYDYGYDGEIQELYFVCNNDIKSTNNGTITLNFGKRVSGKYIYKGIEHEFKSATLTVKTEAGEGFAVLLDK